jgi:putative hydrolase of the HAD superfamily
VIRAITVDFWGTLVLPGPRADDRYKRERLQRFRDILGGAGFDLPIEALSRGYEISGDLLQVTWRQNRDLPVERHVTAILDSAEPGLAARVAPPTLEELIEAYARPALAAGLEPDPGARAALAALVARGYTLAVVSNSMRTPGRALRRLLGVHGLDGFFAHFTFSDEVGVRKPAPEIFHLALARVGADPWDAVHVGDDPVLDVEGARAAGMRVIQVTRPRAPAISAQADLRISGLAELPEAVERLARAPAARPAGP